MNDAGIITRFTRALSLTVIFCALFFSILSCNKEEQQPDHAPGGKKIGVLLVNHGSRSEAWRQALLDLEAGVREDVLGGGTAEGIKTAFLLWSTTSPP